MTTFLTTFNRLFAFVTAALIATLLVATVATFAGVRIGGNSAAQVVAENQAAQTTTAAVITAAVERG